MKKSIILVSLLLQILFGCKKEIENVNPIISEPFELKAGKIDEDSTNYLNFSNTKEIFFNSELMDTVEYYDTIHIDYDEDGWEDFNIIIWHQNVGGIMNVNGYLINKFNISFANYISSYGLSKGESINDSLNWENSENLYLFNWSSGSNPSWSTSFYTAFKFTKNNKVKYGWISTTIDAKIDENDIHKSSMRYKVNDLAYKK